MRMCQFCLFLLLLVFSLPSQGEGGFVHADFTAPAIVEEGISITTYNVFLYNSTYGDSWRMLLFNAPMFDGCFTVSGAPTSAWLTVTHLSSASADCPGGGYSPITIKVNGLTVVSNYDVAENHDGSHGMETDLWDISAQIRSGLNTISWFADDLCTHYWISEFDVSWSAVSAGPDQTVVGGDTVVLSGTGPDDAVSWHWDQIAGQDRLTAAFEPSADHREVQFDTFAVEVGFILTFRMTVVSPSVGEVTSDVNIRVLAANPPKQAPDNFSVLPMDFGPAGLGFKVDWDPVLDAEAYQVGSKVETVYFWSDTVERTYHVVRGLVEGQTRTIAVRGENRFSNPLSTEPLDHGAPSEDIPYTAMRNLARPAALGGTRPPLAPVKGMTYKASRLDILGLNDSASDDETELVLENNDSRDGQIKQEDFWGFEWPDPLFFDHIAYFTGEMFTDGGWFLDLKVQYKSEGGDWEDAPVVNMTPKYDFTDQRQGKKPFTRYDIEIPTLRGTGIRIYGTPGGTATFTSISELEVFGLQSHGPLVVQGIDAEYPEGATAVLNGSLTFSTIAPIASYLWTGPGGITITNSTGAIASFQTPQVSEDKVYVFSLEASDGVNTATDGDVRILVKNFVTTAIAGPDQSVQEGGDVTLDGFGSLSTSGNFTCLWTQTCGPDVAVTGATTAAVRFQAPTIWDYVEQLCFRLDVNDQAGGTGSDEVVVEVKNSIVWPAYSLEGAADTGYVKNLLHLGRDRNDRILAPLGINNDSLAAFGGEISQTPYPGLTYEFSGTGVTVTENPMHWAPVFSDNGWFGNEPFDRFQQIYHLYVLNPAEDRQAHFRFRHADDVRAWNNGVLVIDRDGWDIGDEQLEGFVLKKGVNSITCKFQHNGGGSYFALAITDPEGESFGDLYYSLGPSLFLTSAYASRTAPDSYEPDEILPINLSLRVNPEGTPENVEVVELIPDGLSEGDVNAPGAAVADGAITWHLAGEHVQTQSLSYSLRVPPDTAQALRFQGTLSFGVETTDVLGDSVVYPLPSAPENISVEMFQAAHLSWSGSLTVGTVRYNVYRSVNGGDYELIATTTATSYTDKWLSTGSNYAYRMSAVNVANQEGPLSRPTAPVSVPAMDVRESEDFDYGGGQYPGYQNCPVAIEAPDATDLGAQYDFFHHSEEGSNEYRPANAIPEGLGIETVEEADDPGVYHTNIGWVSVGNWYRYTYDVPEEGWIKLEFRVASPGGGALAAYWDETLIGTVSYNTGNWHIFNWYLMEDQIQTTAGVHTLRVESIAGGMSFDKHAILWNAPRPTRQTIWADNFDSYTTTPDVFSPALGEWTRGLTGNHAGSWTLWDTTGPPLGIEDPDIACMENKYMISNSDLSGMGVLVNEEMLSPEVDCEGWTKLRLNFNYNYCVYVGDLDHTQDAEVDIRSFDSATGWSAWTNLFHLDTSSVPPALDPPILSGPGMFDLSVFDGKKIQLKFHFFNAWYDYWFAVDDVRLSGIKEEAPVSLPIITIADGNVSLSWEAFGEGQYTIMYTTDLLGAWTPVAGPISETDWSTPLPAASAGYYRIGGSE